VERHYPLGYQTGHISASTRTSRPSFRRWWEIYWYSGTSGNYSFHIIYCKKLTSRNANNWKFYLMCAAVNIEGSGTVEPAGVTFPGAYKKGDPGLNFNLYPKNIQTSEKRGYVSSPYVDALLLIFRSFLLLSFVMKRPRKGEDLCFYISSSLETTSANNGYGHADYSRSEAVSRIRSSAEASTKAGESNLSHRRPSDRQDLLQQFRC